MMHLLYIFCLFVKIGMFTFGGGYAMIPLFQAELVNNNHFLTNAEFANMIALAQMTPGPVGMNAATYIGYREGVKALGGTLGEYTAGTAGAMLGTLGVVLPSLTVVLLIAVFLQKFKENPYVRSVLSGIRPAMIGLIAAAVIFFADTSLFTAPFATLWHHPSDFGLDWRAILVFACALGAQLKFKCNILWILIAAAGLYPLLSLI